MKNLLSGFVKTLLKLGFSHFCFVLQREEKDTRMITGIISLGFSLSQNGCFVTMNWFVFWFAETPNFTVFSGCALFGPSCQKKVNFLANTQATDILTDNCKVLFWLFLFYSFYLFGFLQVFFFVYLLVFFEGLRVRWEATLLGPKAPYFS